MIKGPRLLSFSTRVSNESRSIRGFRGRRLLSCNAMNIQLCLILLIHVNIQMPAWSQSDFDLQGHRGCRGLMPENTMPAFLKAVELGVTTLEMDVVISADQQVVVSHEPWMSPIICTHPDGRPVTKSEAKKINLYRMKYAEIQSFDCGMRIHPGFPNQQKVKAVKPTLKIVIKSVERFTIDNKYKQPAYNIEIKSHSRGYQIYIPKPDEFVDLVVNEIRRLGIETQTTLQSFDLNVLEELQKVDQRKFRIAYLVEKGKKIQKNLSKLSFQPEIYSPNYKLLTEASLKQAHDLGLKVIPWTINDLEVMAKLIDWGIDGIITDYPDITIGITFPVK